VLPLRRIGRLPLERWDLPVPIIWIIEPGRNDCFNHSFAKYGSLELPILGLDCNDGFAELTQGGVEFDRIQLSASSKSRRPLDRLFAWGFDGDGKLGLGCSRFHAIIGGISFEVTGWGAASGSCSAEKR